MDGGTGAWTVLPGGLEVVSTPSGLPAPSAATVGGEYYVVSTREEYIGINRPHHVTETDGTFSAIPARTDLTIAGTLPSASALTVGRFGYETDGPGQGFYVVTQVEVNIRDWVRTTPAAALAASLSNSSWSVEWLGEFDTSTAALRFTPSLAGSTDYFWLDTSGATAVMKILDRSTFVPAGTTYDHFTLDHVNVGGGGTYTAGDGLTLTGAEFSIAADAIETTMLNADSDTQKAAFRSRIGATSFDGAYGSLTGTPTIPAAFRVQDVEDALTSLAFDDEIVVRDRDASGDQNRRVTMTVFGDYIRPNVEDEGTTDVTGLRFLNFRGDGVSVAGSGRRAHVDIPGFDVNEIRDDATSKNATPANNDRLYISDESASGDPIDFIEASELRDYMQLGVPGTLTAGTSVEINPIADTLVGGVSVAHGLGQQPDMIDIYLECLIAQHDFVVGDRLRYLLSTGGSAHLVTTRATITNITIDVKTQIQ